MQKEMLNLTKKIGILEKHGIIPSGLNIPIDLKVLDVRGVSNDYSGYKYDSGFYENRFLSIKISHSMVNEPFWITIFEGATYKEKGTRCIIATFEETINFEWQIVLENGTLYKNDCITQSDDDFDGIESIKEVLTAFNYRLYEEDESGLYDNAEGPVFDGNADYLENIISELNKTFFESINIKISKENPDVQLVQNTYKKLIEVASNNFYSVITISDNEVRQFEKFLTQDEAEILFKKECKKYCNENAIEEYIKINNIQLEDNDLSISQWESYFGSESWYDYHDNCRITISKM